METNGQQNTHKSFADMGVTFLEGSGCYTCRDNSCHNVVPLKRTGEEYSVHISTNPPRTVFRVHASANSNTDGEADICSDFHEEADAVKFVCDTFEWFKCF